MLMTDEDIRRAIENKNLEIRGLDENSFKSVAYIARLGKRCLISGNDKEIDVAHEGSVTLNPGEFALFVTEESFKLSDKISGHIGIRSYYARKGIILLAGMHIDPSWDGHLVIGVYNASPRRTVLDYLADIVIIEFHQLQKAPTKLAKNSPEQQQGLLPQLDKDLLRDLETKSLSQISEDIKALSMSISNLEHSVKDLGRQMKFILTALMIILGIVGVLVGGGIIALFRYILA